MPVGYGTSYDFEQTFIESLGENLRKLGSGTMEKAGGAGGRGIASLLEDRLLLAKIAAVSGSILVVVVQWKLVMEVIGIVGLSISAANQLRLGDTIRKLREEASPASDADEKSSGGSSVENPL